SDLPSRRRPGNPSRTASRNPLLLAGCDVQDLGAHTGPGDASAHAVHLVGPGVLVADLDPLPVDTPGADLPAHVGPVRPVLVDRPVAEVVVGDELDRDLLESRVADGAGLQVADRRLVDRDRLGGRRLLSGAAAVRVAAPAREDHVASPTGRALRVLMEAPGPAGHVDRVRSLREGHQCDGQLHSDPASASTSAFSGYRSKVIHRPATASHWKAVARTTRLEPSRIRSRSPLIARCIAAWDRNFFSGSGAAAVKNTTFQGWLGFFAATSLLLLRCRPTRTAPHASSPAAPPSSRPAECGRPPCGRPSMPCTGRGPTDRDQRPLVDLRF